MIDKKHHLHLLLVVVMLITLLIFHPLLQKSHNNTGTIEGVAACRVILIMKGLFFIKILMSSLLVSNAIASLAKADAWLKEKHLNEYGDPEGKLKYGQCVLNIVYCVLSIDHLRYCD